MDRHYFPVINVIEDARDDMPELLVELPDIMNDLPLEDRVAIAQAFAEMVAEALNNSIAMQGPAQEKILAMFSEAVKRQGVQ